MIMRKYIGFFSAVAAAVIALVSCQKEIVDVKSEGNTHSVSIKTVMTKTYLGELDGTTRYLNWTGDETVWAYEGQTLAVSSNVEPEDDSRFAVIYSEFSGDAPESTTYRAIVAKSLSENGCPVLPSEQTAVADSFDSDADIMVSNIGSPTITIDETAALELDFNRPVVINKMTLTGLAEGEKVQEVVFTAAADLAGSIATSYDADGVVSNFSYTGTSKTITVKYANDEAAASDGTFPVYFTSFPAAEGIGAFEVTVTTDKGGYHKTANGASLKFEVGKMTKFKFGLADAEKKVWKFRKVTENLADWSGEYVFADSENHVVTSYSSGAFVASENSYTVRKDIITIPVDDPAYVFTFAKVADDVYSISETYNGKVYTVGYSGDKTNFYTYEGANDENKYRWTLGLEGDSSARIFNLSSISDSGQLNRYIGWNGSNLKVYAKQGGSSDAEIFPYSRPFLFKKVLVDDSEDLYLDAKASKTQNISAAGETVSFTVDTNVDAWEASSSDDVHFAISNKTATSFDVVVDANSTSDVKSATITVSANGVSDVIFTLYQDKKVIVENKSFTINASTIEGFSTSYKVRTWTVDGVSGQCNAYRTGSGTTVKPYLMQFNDSPYVYNTVPVSGRIKSIRIVKGDGGDKTWTVYMGNSVMTTKPAGEGIGSTLISTDAPEATFSSPNDKNYKYFYIVKTTSGATQLLEIVVTYEDAVGDEEPTKLETPSGLSWNSGTKVLSWTDMNTSNGTYGSDYKYQYKIGADGSWADATSATTAELTITETKTVYVKAKSLNATGYTDSDETDGISCTVQSGGPTSMVTKLTNANISQGTAATGYKECSAVDSNGFEYNAYAIQNSHSSATKSQLYWQIKKYASNVAYYVELPTFPGAIQNIKMTVSSTTQAMTGGGNTATLFFSDSNSTSANGTGVASGTGAKEVIIDASSLKLNTGYITAGSGVRIWDIEITYLSK